MVISDSARLLFVHVQRTGGSTVHDRLTEVLPDARQVTGLDRHAPLRQILRAEPALATYWTFGVVRNPWARMLSWFGMVERFRDSGQEGERHPDRKDQFVRSVAETCPDFESFIMKGLDEFSRLQTPQWRHLATKTRRADLIGRQESLEADLRAVQARFDIAWEPLPDTGTDRTGAAGYRGAYSDEMARRVEAAFARDVTAFGYEF